MTDAVVPPLFERLDVLVAKQMGTSREEAQRIIESGHVSAAGRTVLKPGIKLPAGTEVLVTGGMRPFVSRGGEKLEAALAHFGIDLQGLTCLDVGASTGGFTDCMLKRGAARVYAVENGTNQLSPVLRGDPRIRLFEQTDIRSLEPGFFSEPIRFAAVDVSFISLTKVLEPVASLLAPGAGMVCLIKPQYEAGPGHVSKRGVVRDEATRKRTIAQVSEYARSLGLLPQGVIPSPINKAASSCLSEAGQPETPIKQGNQEYLIYLHRKD